MTVKDMAEGGPPLLWGKTGQVPLYYFGPVRFGEAHAAGDPGKMGEIGRAHV
jgi:hypothetical protein